MRLPWIEHLDRLPIGIQDRCAFRVAHQRLAAQRHRSIEEAEEEAQRVDADENDEQQRAV